jgi:hypothetical protein
MKNISKQDLIVIALILIVGFFFGFGVSFIKKREIIAPVQPKVVILPKFVDTDTLSLDLLHKLEIILKKREGLKLKPYLHQGHIYIGYGHLLLKNEKWNNITIGFAEFLLMDDILISFKEVRKLQKNNLYNDIYKMFTSGKLK